MYRYAPFITKVLDTKLEHPGSRSFLFQQKCEPRLRLESDHAPRIDDITNAQFVDSTAVATKAGTTDDPVNGTSQPP